jgi:hypothetical protein
MADVSLPLLLLPRPTAADRNLLSGGAPKVHKPSVTRQQERIAPRLETLSRAFDAKRLKLQQNAAADQPELVVVLETIGSVENFARAVSKIRGLEWLVEWDEEDIVPDDDFFDEKEKERSLTGRLFLVGTNAEALDQLVALWKSYVNDPLIPFARGTAPWKHVFKQLKDIRYWSFADRTTSDVRLYWENELASGADPIRFEIDVWYFQSPNKNDSAYGEIAALLQALGGQALHRALIAEIEYHGVLAQLPADAIQRVLDGEIPELMLSDRIMFFKPRGQSIRMGHQDVPSIQHVPQGTPPTKPPIVALLDGFPQQNHPLLSAWLTLDDPDGWEAACEVKDRVHGTAMASLIIHGELDGPGPTLDQRLYVRALMRPDPADAINNRRTERTPDDVLLIDLVHRAVRRLFEGEGGDGPVAPSIRVINLSLGNEFHVFDRAMSPWARLIDWLAFKYRVLFVVSAGNYKEGFILPFAQNTLGGIPANDQQRASIAAVLNGDAVPRRLISPAESINCITVGAVHADSAAHAPVPGRFDLFASRGLSPISRIGYGFRRAVKPDILMPGGRVLYLERPVGAAGETVLELVGSTQPPGQKTAIPPLPGEGPNATTYCRGTSNAAALTSRHAAWLFNVVESLRQGSEERLRPEFDAVLLKAMLAHGADWASCHQTLLDAQPALKTNTEKQEFLARWLGYGPVDTARALGCTASRATMLGVGAVKPEDALIFSVPLPPSLAGKKVLRRLMLTLAWFSPINPAHRNYRRVRLWITPPYEELRVARITSVFHKTAQRGTLQHEVLEGDQATVFSDGDRVEFKVNCTSDAGEFSEPIPFGLCVSLEVPIETGIDVYSEIRERIDVPVRIQPT